MPERRDNSEKADVSDLYSRHRPLSSAELCLHREIMADLQQQRSLLEEIDARQDDVLSQLDQLNLRIETLLKEVLATREKEERLAGDEYTPLAKAA